MKEIDDAEKLYVENLAETHATILEWLKVQVSHPEESVSCPKDLLVNYYEMLFGVPESYASFAADHLSKAFDHLKKGKLNWFENALWASYLCISVSPIHKWIPLGHQLDTNKAAKLERECWETLRDNNDNLGWLKLREKYTELYSTLFGIEPEMLVLAGSYMADALLWWNLAKGVESESPWDKVRENLNNFYQELGVVMAFGSPITSTPPA